MGRFDALTQLDKKPLTTTPPAIVPFVAADQQTPSPQLENEVVRLRAKPELDKKTSPQVGLPANMQTRLHANLQTSKDASLQTGKPANR